MDDKATAEITLKRALCVVGVTAFLAMASGRGVAF